MDGSRKGAFFDFLLVVIPLTVSKIWQLEDSISDQTVKKKDYLALSVWKFLRVLFQYLVVTRKLLFHLYLASLNVVFFLIAAAVYPC